MKDCNVVRCAAFYLDDNSPRASDPFSGRVRGPKRLLCVG